MDVALRVEDASFTWDAPAPNDGKVGSKKPHAPSHGSKAKDDKIQLGPAGGSEGTKEPEKVFGMSNINFQIPRGKLVAIVGSVGSGKTSLLQGLIGEMRRTSGKITFGGSVGYCSQSAWIQVWLQSLFRNTELMSPRMLQSAKTFVSVGHSNQRDIGRPSRMLAWNLILPCCPTET